MDLPSIPIKFELRTGEGREIWNKWIQDVSLYTICAKLKALFTNNFNFNNSPVIPSDNIVINYINTN